MTSYDWVAEAQREALATRAELQRLQATLSPEQREAWMYIVSEAEGWDGEDLHALAVLQGHIADGTLLEAGGAARAYVEQWA